MAAIRDAASALHLPVGVARVAARQLSHQIAADSKRARLPGSGPSALAGARRGDAAHDFAAAPIPSVGRGRRNEYRCTAGRCQPPGSPAPRPGAYARTPGRATNPGIGGPRLRGGRAHAASRVPSAMRYGADAVAARAAAECRAGVAVVEVPGKRYCASGEAENRIMEAQLDPFGRRASCHRFWANQLRPLLAALACTARGDRLAPRLTHAGQPLRLQRAQAGVGGRDEKAAVLGQAHADVARRGMHVAALEQGAAHSADFGAQGFHLANWRQEALAPIFSASSKKSGPPKLPDFNASHSGRPSA